MKTPLLSPACIALLQLQFVHANPVNLEAPSNSLGSSSWRGDDVGDAIQGYDIDLYYGDADPLSASQVWIPETNPQYSNQNNVPVILTKIP